MVSVDLASMHSVLSLCQWLSRTLADLYTRHKTRDRDRDSGVRDRDRDSGVRDRDRDETPGPRQFETVQNE